VNVDVHAESSGISDTISGSSTIIMNAVADRPDIGEELSAVADSSGHVSDKTVSEKNTTTASMR